MQKKCTLLLRKTRTLPFMQTIKIYTLTNPLTGLVFYVGATSKSFKSRLAGHFWRAEVQSIRRMGQEPLIEEVEECSLSETPERETYWIAQFRAWGFVLENKNTQSGYSQPSPIHQIHRKAELMKYKAEIDTLDINEQDIERWAKKMYVGVPKLKKWMSHGFSNVYIAKESLRYFKQRHTYHNRKQSKAA